MREIPLSPLDGRSTEEREEQKSEREKAGDRPDGVKPSPSQEQSSRLRRSSVQGRVEQLLVRGQDDEERVRDERPEEKAGEKDSPVTVFGPRGHAGREPHERQTSLHDRAPAVARPELRNRESSPARDPRGMLDEVTYTAAPAKRAVLASATISKSVF